jgi:6-phosphogluconolactonase
MSSHAGPTVEVCPDADALALRAAEAIVEAAAAAVHERGRFTLALAGGSTPEKTYGLLAQPRLAALVDWAKAFLFLGDERFVPPDDPRSNYGMAKRSLLDRVPVPPGQVFPIPTDVADAATAAAAYARTLATAFGVPPDGLPPRFDLILLGLGDDAHTASLFPSKPAVNETRAWVTASPPGVLPPPVDRVTLTFPALNAARAVLFLVAGDKKAAVVKEVIESPPDPMTRPASAVRPTDGTVTWLLDEPAARLLSAKAIRHE